MMIDMMKLDGRDVGIGTGVGGGRLAREFSRAEKRGEQASVQFCSAVKVGKKVKSGEINMGFKQKIRGSIL